VKHVTAVLLAFFLKAGGPGLLVLGILDSSFLFAPLGNDLLVVALAASQRSPLKILYYAAMSTVGSVLGCLLVDVVFRKAGEEGLDKHLPRKRLEYVKRKVNHRAAWALAIASLAPPSFSVYPIYHGGGRSGVSPPTDACGGRRKPGGSVYRRRRPGRPVRPSGAQVGSE